MGQYWKAVNLDKKEYFTPHALGAGAKIGEQLGSHVGSALIILTAAFPERRGGGDFDLDSSFYGPERTEEHRSSAPVVEEYNEVAKRTIGRWAGDRVAMVGDYAEDSDLPPEFKASTIYGRCNDEGDYTDVTADVAKVIEHECGGTFVGNGWRRFKRNGHEQSVERLARDLWALDHTPDTWEANDIEGDTKKHRELAESILRFY